MNTNAILARLAAATIFAAGAANAQTVEPPVAVNVDGLPPHVRERILTEAQKGPTALIRYLERTQTVHQLRPQNVIQPGPAPTQAASNADPAKLAQQETTARK